MNVYDLAHGLARALRQHPDVAAMEVARKKIDQDPQAKQMFADFMQKSMELQMQEMSGTEVDEQAKEQLTKLAEIVYLHADIREYQEIAMRVERMLRDVYQIVGNAVSFEQSEE